jgi:hypothetical protein
LKFSRDVMKNFPSNFWRWWNNVYWFCQLANKNKQKLCHPMMFEHVFLAIEIDLWFRGFPACWKRGRNRENTGDNFKLLRAIYENWLEV